MKLFAALPWLAAMGCSTMVSAVSDADHHQQIMGANRKVVAPSEELFDIELSPGVIKSVTEDEKWAIKRVCQHHHQPPSSEPCAP